MDDLSRAFRALWWRAAQGMGHAPPEHALTLTFWCACAAERRITTVEVDDWTSDADARRPALSDAGRVLFRVATRGGGEAVLDVDGAIVYVSRGSRGRVHVTVGGRSDADVARALARLRAAIPKKTPTGCRVEMKFWSYCHGASDRDETVEVCSWDEVSTNYAARTREQLDALMQARSVTDSGKLVLWLGPPGTGKTFALRALAWEHRERLAVHYVLDPETFLERVDYVTSVFLDSASDPDDDDDDGAGAFASGDERGRSPTRARLIVLEDAGELLGADAMSRVGHGLSRLLNLTDGLPGQATSTRILITTNEDVGRLHPAVTRAGRCAALVRFAPLDDKESAAWLGSRNRADLATSRKAPSTIADLFALIRGEARPPSSFGAVGFVGNR